MPAQTPTKTTTPAVQPSETKTEAKPESAASKASRTAPVDLSFLTATKPVQAAAPTRAEGAGRKAQDNSQFEAWLKASWDERKEGENTGVGYALPNLPLDSLGVIKSRFNTAARTLNLGVSFAVDENSDKKTATLRYVAKTRKQSKKGK